MNRTIHAFFEEPRGAAFQQLLRMGQILGARGLVVVRREDRLADSARAVLKALGEFGTDERITSTWPGTVLYGDTARVKEFRLTDDAVAVLTTAAGGLFDWLAPTLPEDLSLVRADGSPLLTNIAHERDAFLELSSAERDQFDKQVPEVLALTKEEKASPSSSPGDGK